MKTRLLLLAALTIMAGCTAGPEPNVDNRETALREIRAVEEAFAKAFGERNADLAASFYAADADLMLTNMKIIKGAEVKGFLKEMMADPNFSLTFGATKVEASKSGDVGYTRGVYTLTMTDPKTKKAVTETGKYLTIFSKQADGNWKVVEDITNADAPAQPKP